MVLSYFPRLLQHVYLGGKTPATFWVGQPMSNSGVAENKMIRMAAVHNLLAPLTEIFNLRIRAPPRTVPSTASGIQIPPEIKKSGGQTVEFPVLT